MWHRLRPAQSRVHSQVPHPGPPLHRSRRPQGHEEEEWLQLEAPVLLEVECLLQPLSAQETQSYLIGG